MPDDENRPSSSGDETGKVGRVADERTPETRPEPDKHTTGEEQAAANRENDPPRMNAWEYLLEA